MKHLLLTGGCGFLGHHVVEHVLRNTDWRITILDRLTYAASGFDRLREIGAYEDPRVCVFTHDVSRRWSVGLLKEIGRVDYVVHAAAETDVNRSIRDPEPFVQSNVVGTFRLLEAIRDLQPELTVICSTDEVYGPAPDGVLHWEGYPLRPTNPYAACKAGAEMLALSYANSYSIPILITNTMNLMGERQHPEKFIPQTVDKVLRGETVTVHANRDRTRSGSRFYLHCRNYAAALLFLLDHAVDLELGREMSWDRLGGGHMRVNVVGEREVTNLELAQRIADVVGKPLKYELTDFHSSRPGHDLRYGLDGTRLAALGFKYPVRFDASLEKTIRWTLDHPRWLQT